MSRAQTQVRRALDAANTTALNLEREAERRHRLAELAIERARRAADMADESMIIVRQLTAALKQLEHS